MGKRRRAQPVVAVVKSAWMCYGCLCRSARADQSIYPYIHAGRKKARQIVTAFHKAESELAELEQAKGQVDPGTKAERVKQCVACLIECCTCIFG